MSDGLRVLIEEMRGELRVLDTNVRASLAEQKRINDGFMKRLERVEDKAAALDKRLAVYSGGVLVIIFVIEIGSKFLMRCWGG
ncbi:MAG: hypothetical protein BZ151_13095 [Desulfobacca sp. 4484_104]|nr:MAG: hypothetical protein BZ151_13095 [Desulfobacca sp. 4484_104]